MSALRSLTGVTPITGEFVVTRCMVRVQKSNASNDSYTRLVAILQRSRFTGTVTIGMTEGNVRTLSAEDRAPLDGLT